MLSRIYRYVRKEERTPSPSEITNGQTDRTFDPEVEEIDEVDLLADELEGDSLIIDESRSGPIYNHILRPQQYGTSFANAVDFKSDSDFKLVKFNSEVDLFPKITKLKNEYETKINKFYLPDLHRLEKKVPSGVISDERFKYSVDYKLQEVEDEKKEKVSKVVPLSPEQLQEVNKALRDHNSQRVVVSNYQIDITVRDIQTLRPQQWLNDNIIDYYFNLISDQNSDYYSWTSHFYTTLQERGYDGVRRWSKRRKLNLFEKKLIFIPINISSTHWALSIINNQNKTIEYFDSLRIISGEFSGLYLIKSYMEGEVIRLGASVDISEYRFLPNSQVPQQKNGFDCGVFTCICANYLSQSKGLDYSQKDMPIFRHRMIYEILHGKLLK
ncbi:Ulp1 protease family protein [Yamadazyma tenuis]|uniref:Cysteine proteinase n=1 Tax=Candida tenuis (strain ATCC 10573 / BCRC 21748 / CBS 615 / JCM 9827 / NBRC 10315 / NRRL Y-1498 / VKM Y-70) TaxID=590646 RepID=G3B5X4_CANTC|nr:cysteine proteinase [Yamadazyma tenuis ATCC 10573]EGV63326.1 cysteine proteinase [Yamadazyma tenuis ATCC 10573]WEJ96854.1 Ulp1 protease family protein [Yamadazyma tenuis]